MGAIGVCLILVLGGCNNAGTGGGGGGGDGGGGDGGGGTGGDGVFLASPVKHTIREGLPDAIDVKYVAVGDVDGTNGDDVVVVAYYYDGDPKGYVYLFQNDGSGTFTEREIDDEYGWPDQVIIVDLDEDGDLDIVVCGAEDPITWYRNENAATSFTKLEIETGSGTITARRMDIADVDGSDGLDIVAAHPWIFRNNGSESFTRLEVATDSTGYPDVAIGDLDGDGDLDLVNVSEEPALSWIEQEDPAGTFSTEHTLEEIDEVTINWSVIAVDLDQDGNIDIVGAADYPGNLNDSIYWHRNQGGGTFATKVPLTPVGTTAEDLLAVDIDDDGDLDLVVADEDHQEVVVWVNDGAENFSKHLVAEPFDVLYPRSVAVGDFDGDGNKDIVVVDDNETSVVDDVAWYSILSD